MTTVTDLRARLAQSEERSVAKALSPAIAWPTLALAIVLPAAFWPGGALPTLRQNPHLTHHLWPGVPFYNYGRFWRRLRPTLVSRGARIEGLMVGPYAKDHSSNLA